MAQQKQTDRGKSGGGDAGRRRTRRKRTVLNLGMPFFPVDDFVNQSEDAVALGYRVLEETIEAIRDGYHEARQFNRRQREFVEKQKAFERGDGPAPVAPSIPWEEMVERVQTFQAIAFDAVSDGTELFFDTIRSGTRSTGRLARTWERSREDADAPPALAGPVFEEPIEIEARPGDHPDAIIRPIRHKGLTRLRIDAIVDPSPVLIPRPRRSSAKSTELHEADEKAETVRFRSDMRVSFEPADRERYDDATSVLKVEVGAIPDQQKPGIYEGFIRAANFELLIARLRIRVLERAYERTAL